MIALVIPILLALVLESNAGCACKPCSCMKPKCPPPVVCPPPMCRPPKTTHVCCNKCKTPCRFRRDVQGLDEIFNENMHNGSSSHMIHMAEDNSVCNNKRLKEIMIQNLSNDMAISKGNIQNAAEEAMKAHINVICAKGDLSYSTHTDSFCQAENDAITCYAFKA